MPKTKLDLVADAIRNNKEIPPVKMPRNKAMVDQGDPELNRKYASLAIELLSWGKSDKSNPDELFDRFIRYLNYCQQNNIKVGNQGAYLAMDITKDDVYDWENGRRESKAHSELIRKVKTICSMYREGAMADGKIPPAVGIFWQKNYDGMRDEQNIVLEPKKQMNDVDAVDIAKRLPTAVQLEQGED